ncbi:Raf serine/threonine-protein kinase-like 2 [Homarus americanus]|uniref:Raf serine/threonine-protein kinase-like 2 n=2 Tax=Homarus americanus TaxID=6706 RepID=A0A8J5J7L3_HOMAM|nr:Raf serine/threonine-protein kinase-like 4 [Homarus americanus]KAG7155376.1 Raf serine/threonine-protein kinase-like 3 [Homarus americanus]KAG7156884.1 Raf serine/threonine-protein kinase-like 2 [Homarus americanus]
MDYTGDTYDDFLQYANTHQKVLTLIKIAEALSQIHDKNIIHNDLKTNNVTVTLQEDQPTVHIIDFGKAKIRGTFKHNKHPFRRYWEAPEFTDGDFTSPESDTYSFGQLVKLVATLTHNPVVQEGLQTIVDMTTSRSPLHRASLPEVVRVMNEFLPIAN